MSSGEDIWFPESFMLDILVCFWAFSLRWPTYMLSIQSYHLSSIQYFVRCKYESRVGTDKKYGFYTSPFAVLFIG